MALTSSETVASDAAPITPRGARPGVTRALMGAGFVVLIGAATVLGFSLADDPFAELPGNSAITANVAGTLPAEGEEPMQEPAGIAIHGNRVYVADSEAGLVRIFDRYGQGKGRIVLPAQDDTVSRPGALVFADENRLAIVDGGQNRVVVVDARADEKAEVLFVLGDSDEGTAPLRPVAVAYAAGEYYVIGSAEAGVRVYDAEGEPVREVQLDPENHIEYPGGLLVADGTIWVTDTKSGRVFGFSAETGEAAGEWPDTYTVPRGMALVGNGFAVADVLGQAVFVCDAEGVRTHALGGETVADLSFALPEAVAWDAVKSRLYVADSAGENVVVLNVRMK